MNVGLVFSFGLSSLAAVSADDQDEPEARLSGTTIVTANLQESIRFYTEVLGFRETRIRKLSPASLTVYGVNDDTTATYTALLPAEWSKENPYLSSINFVQIDGIDSGTFEYDAGRTPLLSEVILAYRV